MPKKSKYDKKLLDIAVREVKNGDSYRNVSIKYGIPKSTIEFKLKNPGHRECCGPPPILTTREEDSLAQWILDVAKKGFPRKKEEILTSVQKFLNDNPRKNPFKDNRPGDGWLKAFLKRHPEIAERTSEAVSYASACVTEKDIRKWFLDVENYIMETNLNDAIKDPSRIYNGDETGFQICPKTGKVYAAKGAKNVYTVEKGASKESITVMFTFSASGKNCCPMIIYPYKRIPEKIATTVNPEWGIGRSDNGWMTAATFSEYISNVFYPHLIQNKVDFPVILFVDGHKTHLTYELSLICKELQIELIALYPNSTRILQPADVSVFGPFKSTWKQSLRQWQIEHPGETLNKVTFAPLLEQVIDKSMKPETISNGFERCGLYPFDANAVDYSKCLGRIQNSSDERNEDEHPIMTYNDFTKIVSPERIKQFEDIDVIAKEDGSFWDLYRLWQFFKTNVAIKKINVIENRIIQMASSSNESTDIIETIENQGVTTLNSDECLDKNKNFTGTLEADNLANENDTSIILIDSNKNTISKETICKEVVEPSTSYAVNSDMDNKNLQLQLKTSFADYLPFPNVPERKGKRQTERLPFAITSQAFQEMCREKKEKTDRLNREKEERKRKREESKLNTLNAKKTKNTKSCCVCKYVIRGTNKLLLQCDTCNNYFHYKCIPKSHHVHIPSDKEDKYLCLNCYQEESDTYSDVEELYEMYLNETQR